MRQKLVKRQNLARAILLSTVVFSVSACVSNQPNWYEQHCIDIGFKVGTVDFEKCIERDKAWIEADRKRAESTKHR